MRLICISLVAFLLFSTATSAHGAAAFAVDSIAQTQTVIIAGIKYTAVNIFGNGDAPNRFYVKDRTGKVVYSLNDGQGVIYFKFKDFNGDGYKDLILERRGVDSGQQDLVLFNPVTKKLVLAGDCSNAEKIPGTYYFYNYQDCCMGRYWSSELFFISNYKVINIGHIKYDDGSGLSFYRLKGKQKIFLEKWHVHINGSSPVATGKHIDFSLKQYWRKSWRRFIG